MTTTKKTKLRQLRKADLTMEVNGKKFPFTEDEHGHITGYGHQDPDRFAAAINRYDKLVGNPDNEITADHVTHTYITVADDGENLRIIAPPGRPGDPTPTPVTTVWGVR